MKRLMTGLIALIVFAAACGSGDSAEDVIAELGLSDAEVACFEAEFDERGLDMDSILTAERADLSSDDLQAVLDISAECATGGNESAGSTEPDTGSDDASVDDGGDAGDDATDEPADEPTEPETTDPPADSARRSYADLTGLEQAFVDGLVGSGGTVEIGICLLDEFEAAGIGILEMAELGLNDGEPTSEMMAAVFRCGDEIADSGAFDAGDLFSGAEGVTYGDNPELDALWDACADGDLASCDDLYYDSAIGSDYEAFGSTCGETTDQVFGRCSVADADTYGDNAELDVLWDACADGDLVSCDDLYYGSGIGTQYEAFGSTCGATQADRYGRCSSDDALSYGEDPELDALWDGCAGGDLASCDTLYFDSAIGSDYEAFGSTCGETTTDTFGNCAGGTEPASSENYGDDPELDALWDGCAGGDLAACDELWFNSPIGSAYEAFAESCGGLSTEENWGSCEANLGG